jgi:hypothetical protein
MPLGGVPRYVESTALESGRLMINPSKLKGKGIYLCIWIFKFQIDGILKILERALVSVILPMLQKSSKIRKSC